MYIKEVTASIYAWDCADEGIKNVVDCLKNRCGINSLYLVAIVHHEKRPLTSLFFTHNPVRKFFVPENSRMYYRPDMNNFNGLRLQPHLVENETFVGIDWLDVTIQEARRRNLRTGAELSHTIFDTNIATHDYPDIIQLNVVGKPVNAFLPFICPNNPDVYEYICTVFYDVVKNHDLDFIQTALFGFSSGFYKHLPTAPWFYNDWMDTERPRLSALMAVATGGCFCEHCSVKAKTMGYDWDLIVRDVSRLYRIISATNYKYQDEVMENHLLLGSDLTETGLMTEFPGMWEFINFRIDCMTKLFEDISDRVHSVKKDIDLRFNNCFKLPEFNGYSIKRIAPYINSLRDSDYLEQYGNPGHYAIKRNAILNMRRGLGFDKNLLASIPVRPNATPEIIRQSLKVLKTLGIDGISLAHYDSAYLDHLDAFGLGLKEENYILLK